MNSLEYTTTAPKNLQPVFGTKSAWEATVTAQVNHPTEEALTSGTPSQSKICFVSASISASHCTYLRDLFKLPLTYQTITGLSVIPLTSRSSNTKGLMLKAEALYTNASVRETAIWIYDSRADEFHVAAALESSEFRVVSEGSLAGCLITADWDRAKGEARWDDHRRDITVYRLGGKGEAQTYQEVLRYTTAMKYSAEDTDTISSQINTVLARL